MSYHNLLVWAPAVGIDGVYFSSLSFSHTLSCHRTTGWQLRIGEEILGEEFSITRPLRVVVPVANGCFELVDSTDRINP